MVDTWLLLGAIGALLAGWMLLFSCWRLLASRAQRKLLLREQLRPLEDRIADIREDALFMIEQLQRILNQCSREKRRPFNWVSPTLDLYRRLHGLASRSDATVEEVDRFGEEATTFVRQHLLKGIYLDLLAQNLADVAHRRNAA